MIKFQDILNEAKKLKETFEEFAKIRAAGAAKIAETAEKKRWISTFNLAPL